MKRLSLLALGLTISLPAAAATYTVNRTDDVHTAVATACLGAANDCSLRDAIRKANQNAETSNKIVVPAGIYTLTLTSPGEDNAYNGDLDIKKDLTIQGAGADPACGPGSTCVDGGGATINENAFSVLNDAAVEFQKLTVRNSALSGILVNASISGGLVTVSECALIGNRTGLATAGPNGEVVLRNSKVSGNLGNGGVSNNNFKMTIEDSTISGNHNENAGGGGGVGNFGTTGDLTIANSTISGNTTEGDGGGVRNAGTAVLRNVTVTGNEASTGGGLYTAGDLLFENSIFAGNTASHGSDCIKHATLGLFDSKGYNIIGTTTNCVISPADTDIAGDNSSPVDPKLGFLEDNGGNWETHLLLDGSPAIDGGDPAGCHTANGARTADQRGAPSPLDGNGDGTAVCDMGAVEIGCSDGVIETGEECDDGNASDGDGCSATCANEVVPTCGDGILQSGEQCDDGNTDDTDACKNDCTLPGGATGGTTAGTGTAGGTTTGGTTGGASGSGGGCSLLTPVNR